MQQRHEQARNEMVSMLHEIVSSLHNYFQTDTIIKTINLSIQYQPKLLAKC